VGLQAIDNTGKSVHRILCTDLQEAIAMGIVSGSRMFIGSQEDFYKAAIGAGFVSCLRHTFDGTTRVNHGCQARQ
jgi:hypothetical protein